MTVNRLRYILLSLATLVLSSGCSKNLEVHGYAFHATSISKIQINTSNFEDVIEHLGSPTVTAVYGEPKFLYISHVYEERPLFYPKLVDQKILEIVFSREGRVRHINWYSMKDYRDVHFLKEKMHLPGNDITVLEQIIGNIGKFNNTQNIRKPGT